jgi:hypothetical protein
MALQKTVREVYRAQHMDIFQASKNIFESLRDYSFNISHERPNKEDLTKIDREKRVLLIPSVSAFLEIIGRYNGGRERDRGDYDFKSPKNMCLIEARLSYVWGHDSQGLEVIRNAITKEGLIRTM